LRVTVVATGLGAQAQMERSQKTKDEIKIKKKVAGDGAPDYSDFERPTVIRNAVVNGTDEVDLQADKDLDYLDIPAFLRRQAD